MRVHLHDGSGHPFQVELSRVLAARGHEVLHTYATQFVSPRGRLTCGPTDPPTLRIEGITAPVPFDKYAPLSRMRWEVAYTRAWREVLSRNPADVVISCNTQLFVAARMRRHFRRARQPWVLWHQDIASLALSAEARNRLPGVVAEPVAALMRRAERALVRDAGAVVALAEPFRAQYESWGLDVDHVDVIPNWAPLDDITPVGRDAGQAWAERADLPPADVRLLYAGTLGRKHNPELLLDLVQAVRAAGVNAQLVAVSEGAGADDLRAAADGMPFVRVLPYQPAEELSAVLASADIALALLEPDASQFSVPSKVLSYLAAGRPIVALAPETNPCATDVVAGGGFIAGPDLEGVKGAAEWIVGALGEPGRLQAIGNTARAYAETTFDVERVADRFEEILHRAVTNQGRRR